MKHIARITRRSRILLATAVAVAVTHAGCDAFLETDPLGQATSENFFESREHAIQGTNATYSMLRDWTVHVFSWIGATDIVSDDATKGSTPTDASFLLELDNLTFDATNIAFLDTWRGYYQGIYRANVALQNIPPIEMDETLKARLLGENQFLRAYYYFYLVRAFGGVPLLTEPLEPGEFEQPRASAEEIYNLIEQDLLAAIEVLPEASEYSSADAGRATKGAARALLALAYLYQGEYDNAQRYAEEVINSGEYSLYPDYRGIFTEAGENSSESVFEVQAIALEQGGGSSQYSEVQGVRSTPNLGWGFNQPSDQLEAAYEPGDPRQQATILFPWEIVSESTGEVVHMNTDLPNQRYNEKVQPPLDNPGGPGNSPVNIRRIRYADVLLVAAEAAYHNGDEGTARRYLNMVRERARGGQQATLGITEERLSDAIALNNLGLPSGSSRVFARYVDPEGPAGDAGLRSFDSEFFRHSDGSLTPLIVNNIDIIQSVNGTPITTLASFRQAITSVGPGGSAAVEVLRVTQEESSGDVTTNTQTLQLNILAVALLPDVTASGQELLEAIWHERRVELALEQHRWFDIRRQDRVQPGRARALMQIAGKDFIEGRHELYPIPLNEIDLSGGLLEQNPGY